MEQQLKRQRTGPLDSPAGAGALETAWLLRGHVVPCLAPCDAVRLWASSAALLGSACTHRLGSAAGTRVAALDLFASSCLAGDAATMSALVSGRRRIVSRTPELATLWTDYLDPLCRKVAADDRREDVLRVLDAAGLGVRAAGEHQPTAVEALHEVCRHSMPCTIAALLGPRLFDPAKWEQSRSVYADHLIERAASSGDPAVLQLLSGPPLSLAHGSVTESALQTAITKGGVQCLRVLTSAPYFAGVPSSYLLRRALRCACTAGDRGCVDYLGQFEGWDAIRPFPFAHDLLIEALKGTPEAFRALTSPPFSLDARCVSPVDAGDALIAAARAGNEAIVGLLSDASFGVDHEDSVASFVAAAASGSVGVMRRLMQPPFCVGPGDVDSCHDAVLYVAEQTERWRWVFRGRRHVRLSLKPKSLLSFLCFKGQLGALEMLMQPPFLLGSKDTPESKKEALNWACKNNHPDVVRALAKAPASLGQQEAQELRVLTEAIKNRHIDVARVLVETPYSLGRGDIDACTLFKHAVRMCDAELIRMAGRPPLSLFGPGDARADENEALCHALGVGQSGLEVVRALAEPPYCLGAEDARARSCEALKVAFGSKNMAGVRLLAQPPFCLGASDARASDNAILRKVCASGDAEALKVLSEPPFCLGHAEAQAIKAMTLAGPNERTLQVLTEPPYSMGPEDAREDNNKVLRAACRSGNAAVLATLARLGLGQEDARAAGNEALFNACKYGWLDIVVALGKAPWSLGQEDARANKNRALWWAVKELHVGVVRLLGQAPYSLTRSDALAAGDGATVLVRWSLRSVARGSSDWVALYRSPGDATSNYGPYTYSCYGTWADDTHGSATISGCAGHVEARYMRHHCKGRAHGCSGGSLWGTNIYTSDSNRCAAALHCGAIGPDGGDFTVNEGLPGLPAYPGSASNGVTSGSYGPYSGSIMVLPVSDPQASAPAAAPAAAAAPAVVAPAVPQQQCGPRGDNKYFCKGQRGGCSGGYVYGSDLYAKGSNLCSAALHCGAVGPEGGEFLVEDGLPGQRTYPSAERNGVTTSYSGACDSSIRIHRADSKEFVQIPDSVAQDALAGNVAAVVSALASNTALAKASRALADTGRRATLLSHVVWNPGGEDRAAAVQALVDAGADHMAGPLADCEPERVWGGDGKSCLALSRAIRSSHWSSVRILAALLDKSREKPQFAACAEDAVHHAVGCTKAAPDEAWAPIEPLWTGVAWYAKCDKVWKHAFYRITESKPDSFCAAAIRGFCVEARARLPAGTNNLWGSAMVSEEHYAMILGLMRKHRVRAVFEATRQCGPVYASGLVEAALRQSKDQKDRTSADLWSYVCACRDVLGGDLKSDATTPQDVAESWGAMLAPLRRWLTPQQCREAYNVGMGTSWWRTQIAKHGLERHCALLAAELDADASSVADALPPVPWYKDWCQEFVPYALVCARKQSDSFCARAIRDFCATRVAAEGAHGDVFSRAEIPKVLWEFVLTHRVWAALEVLRCAGEEADRLMHQILEYPHDSEAVARDSVVPFLKQCRAVLASTLADSEKAKAIAEPWGALLHAVSTAKNVPEDEWAATASLGEGAAWWKDQMAKRSMGLTYAAIAARHGAGEGASAVLDGAVAWEKKPDEWSTYVCTCAEKQSDAFCAKAVRDFLSRVDDCAHCRVSWNVVVEALVLHRRPWALLELSGDKRTPPRVFENAMLLDKVQGAPNALRDLLSDITTAIVPELAKKDLYGVFAALVEVLVPVASDQELVALVRAADCPKLRSELTTRDLLLKALLKDSKTRFVDYLISIGVLEKERPPVRRSAWAMLCDRALGCTREDLRLALRVVDHFVRPEDIAELNAPDEAARRRQQYGQPCRSTVYRIALLSRDVHGFHWSGAVKDLEAATDFEWSAFHGSERRSLLHAAAEEDGDTAQELLAAALRHKAPITAQDRNGRTPVHVASAHSAKRLRELLKAGGSHEAFDGNGHNALHTAVAAGQHECAAVLVEAGARVNAPGTDGRTALHTAAAIADEAAAKMLLGNGASVSVADRSGDSPLHAACASESAERAAAVAALLMSNGADCNKKGAKGRLPLHCACVAGSQALVSAVAEHTGDLNVADEDGSTALLLACSGSGNGVADLMRAGADPEIADNSGLVPLVAALRRSARAEEVALALLEAGAKPTARSGSPTTPLHVAVSAGLLQAAQALMAKGAPVDSVDEHRETALHAAARVGHVKIVTALLEHGAKCLAASETRKLPMHVAQAAGHEQCAALLLERTIDEMMSAGAEGAAVEALEFDAETTRRVAEALRGKSGDPAQGMRIAAQLGLADLVAHFLSKGVAPNSTDKSGTTALHCACRAARKDVVALLLRSKASAKLATKDTGSTPLHDACLAGSSEIAAMLLAAGAPAGLAARDGSTPLHSAAAGGSAECVRVLVQARAEVGAKTASGRTALSVAAEHAVPEVVKALLDAGLSPKGDKDSTGMSPLLYAVTVGATKAVELLLQSSADPNETAPDGKPCLVTSAQAGHWDVLRALLAAKADPNAPAARSGQMALFCAVHMREDAPEDVVVSLLQSGARPDATPSEPYPKRSTLAHCVSRAMWAAVAELCKAGADASRAYADGLTPLHLACAGDAGDEALALVLGRPLLINARDPQGYTPLSRCRTWTSVALLLRHGADAASRTPTGVPAETVRSLEAALLIVLLAEFDRKKPPARPEPAWQAITALLGCSGASGAALSLGKGALAVQTSELHIAARGGDLAVVRQALTVCGPSGVVADDFLGNTPLHYACRWGHADAALLLLNAMASEPKQLLAAAARSNSEGRSAVEYALDSEMPSVVQQLLSLGLPCRELMRVGFASVAACDAVCRWQVARLAETARATQGKAFTDPDFAPSDQSTMEFHDIEQGGIGTCYLLATVAALVVGDPAFVRTQIFYAFDNVPDAGALGIHSLRLHNDCGRAVFVTLDDCVPCGSTKRKGDTEPRVQPIYAWTRQRDVWYVSLIEKAFAKLHGCYEAIDGGVERYAKECLTAGTSASLALDSWEMRVERARGTLWSRVSAMLSNPGHMTHLLTCSIDGGAEKRAAEVGLISGHAYTVLGCVCLARRYHLVRLLNPYGDDEWKGCWSDYDTKSWTPKLREQAGLPADSQQRCDDGTFFIEFETDFLRFFTSIDICSFERCSQSPASEGSAALRAARIYSSAVPCDPATVLALRLSCSGLVVATVMQQTASATDVAADEVTLVLGYLPADQYDVRERDDGSGALEKVVLYEHSAADVVARHMLLLGRVRPTQDKHASVEAWVPADVLATTQSVVVLALLYRPAGEGSATCKGLTLTVTLSPEPGAEKTSEASEVVVATLGQRTEGDGEQRETANATTQGHAPAIRRGKKWYADDEEDSIVDNARAKGPQGQQQQQQQQQQAALEERLRALEQKMTALEHAAGSPTAAKRQQQPDKGSDVKLPMLSDRSGSSSDLATRTRALEQRVAAAESAVVAAPAAARKTARKDGPSAPDGNSAGLTATAAAVARMTSNTTRHILLLGRVRPTQDKHASVEAWVPADMLATTQGVVVLALLYRPAGEGSATCKGLTLTVTLSPEPGAEKTSEASEVVVATLGQRT
eukprot:m51a1_g8231 hypothetical protein (3596) ;mRNA; f:49800-62713